VNWPRGGAGSDSIDCAREQLVVRLAENAIANVPASCLSWFRINEMPMRFSRTKIKSTPLGIITSIGTSYRQDERNRYPPFNPDIGKSPPNLPDWGALWPMG
jgi:hypothetical protein